MMWNGCVVLGEEVQINRVNGVGLCDVLVPFEVGAGVISARDKRRRFRGKYGGKFRDPGIWGARDDQLSFLWSASSG